MNNKYAIKLAIICLVLTLAWPSATRALWSGNRVGTEICGDYFDVNTIALSPQTCPEPALPTDVLASPSVITCGETAYLTATSAGNRIKWFTTPTGGTELGNTLSGLAFPVNPVITTVYYAEAYNSNCTNTNRVAVTLIVNPPAAPTNASVSNAVINCGEYTELSATSDGNMIHWYNASSGGTFVGSSASGFNLPVSPQTTTTYYAEAAGACVSTSRSPVVVTVNAAPEPSPVSAYPASVCYGSTTDLTAFSSGYSINWYDANYGGNFLGTTSSGSSFNITVYNDTTLYAESYFSNSSSASFSYTGATQTWTVPAGVTVVDVVAWGAQGGNQGGLGAKVKSRLSVIPGSVLYINVGSQGGTPDAGWNGGGIGGSVSGGAYYGGGGGGATDIRLGGNSLTNRLLVAAGGGGKGGASSTNPSSGNGGNGGGEYGSDGFGIVHSCVGSNAGLGATQITGGNGGAVSGCGCIFTGTSGNLGIGGNGASGEGSGQPGGGGAGGGGYFGGGGAGCTGCDTCAQTDLSGAGGGGGSSWTDPMISFNTLYLQDNRTGDGQLDITWESPTCVSLSRTPVYVPSSIYTEPGGVSGGGTSCPGVAADTLRLTSYAGSIIRWEVSSDSGNTWTSIANTQPYYLPTITDGGVYWYRAIVKSGSCPAMESSYAVVSIPSANGIAMRSGRSVECAIPKPDNWRILINSSNKMLASVCDSSGNWEPGSTSAYLTIDPQINYEPNNHEAYMQRHLRLETIQGKSSRVKLYFTQEDLDALMTAVPTVLSAWDLAVTMVADTQTWKQTQKVENVILTENDPSPGIYSLEVGARISTTFYIQGKTVEVLPPTTILSFEASCKNGMAVVNWVTTNENGTKNFAVESSNDLNNWVEVTVVESAGNSSTVQKYSVIDESGTKGTVYYRLLQTGFDGRTTYTTPVPANCDSRTELIVNYYPNPCRNELMVAFTKDIDKTANVMIYDAGGKVVMVKVLTETEMQNGIAILNVSDMIPGVYTVDFISGQGKKAMNVIKN
ncbi:MAG: glycine-rich protein [Bacteroidota bacterium]